MASIAKVKFNGIKQSPWFKDLPDQALEMMTDVCSIQEYSEGDVVYGFGEQRKYIYGVLSGCVQISMTSDRQQHFSLIDFHENSWFGESALLVFQSKVITVTTLERSTILVLPAKEFADIAEQYPVIYKNMYFDKLRSMQLLYDMLSGLLTYPLKARMAMKLLPILHERGVVRDDGIILNPSVNLKEWARLSMGSLQRIMLIFDEWVEQGMIVHSEGGWFFPDIDILRIEINR